MNWDAILKWILENLLPIVIEIIKKLIDSYLGKNKEEAIKVHRSFQAFLATFHKATDSKLLRDLAIANEMSLKKKYGELYK